MKLGVNRNKGFVSYADFLEKPTPSVLKLCSLPQLLNSTPTLIEAPRPHPAIGATLHIRAKKLTEDSLPTVEK